MHGLEEMLQRDWGLLVGREHGPLAFRMVLQPLVAAALAVRAGLRDARTGERPFGWTVATNSSRRGELVRQGWKDVGRLFFVAVVVDAIYQVIVFRTIYPIQALIVASLLAFPSYVVVRGLTDRLARHLGQGPGGSRP
ncbi:MAG: hypothetical protein U1E59_20930 [Amaricoccus sp.]